MLIFSLEYLPQQFLFVLYLFSFDKNERNVKESFRN